MRTAASSFDPELFAQIEKEIAAMGGEATDTPNVAEIELAETEEQRNIENARVCYEFVNSPIYSLSVESLRKIERREKEKFEEAEQDLNGLLRANWHATRRVVNEIIQNWEMAARVYVEAQEEVRQNGVLQNTEG